VRDRIPEATVARLPVYLRCLVDMSERGTHRVSSDQLADAAGVNSAKVRKDLSYLGSYGTRGVGYDVEYLIYQVRRELGLEQDWAVAIVGVGNLGRALANYRGFAERGFRIAALLDADGDKVGEELESSPSTTSTTWTASSRRSRWRSASSPPRPPPPRRCATGWSRPASPRS
jgi:redox-sensing transcriptional repressor